MKPSDLSRTLTAVLPAGRPVYVWGPPGVGKSRPSSARPPVT